MAKTAINNNACGSQVLVCIQKANTPFTVNILFLLKSGYKGIFKVPKYPMRFSPFVNKYDGEI